MAKNKEKKFRIIPVILRVVSVFLAVIIISIPAGFGIVIYLNSSSQSPAEQYIINEIDGIVMNDDGSFLFDVRRGESSQSVGLRLERAGLINNRYFWNLLCRFYNEHIKTGTYRIELPSTQMSILRLLVSGRQILHRVTIPEGVTLNKMAAILEDAGICNVSEFLAAASNPDILAQYGIPNSSMEGYLFPDTYMFPAEFPAEQAVRTMADNFFYRLENHHELGAVISRMSPQELNDRVILASIVEREYRVMEEAAVMAGVFQNRLNINMALQSCATVEYIITEIQGKPHPSVLLYVDLEIQNPYNTYIYRGLPPGPISAPGMVALTAAIFPETTNYLYFRLTDPATGRHYFSRTYDEHIRAGLLIPKG